MTWLFSKAMMQDYESLPYSQAQAAAYSAENYLDGAPFAQLNVMPTPHKFWRNDKTMDCSKLSQFGLTCQLLTESRGEALLMSYLAAFHVRTLAPQEKEQALQAKEAAYGKSSHGLLAKYDQDTHSWKTAQCSLLEDWTAYSVNLPSSGTMQNGACYLRPMLAQTMSVKESGLLPNGKTFHHTPNTTGMDGGSNSRKALKKRMQVAGAVMKFATPQASDNRGRGNLSSGAVMRRIAIGKQISLSQSVSEVSGNLNPTWTEWLMGFPLGWTSLRPLVTRKFRYALQRHSTCLRGA